MANRTGGGPNSKVVGNYLDAKREPINNVVSPGAVSRLGAVVGVGTPYKNLVSSVASTPVGATNNTQNLGPGGCGRVVMRAGSQSPTPAARPMPAATRKF
jgi:hypothetical protein